MKLEVFIFSESKYERTEKDLFDTNECIRLIVDEDPETTLGDFDFRMRNEIGELYFYGNKEYYEEERKFNYFIVRNDIIYFNPPILTLTISEYLEFFCKDKKRFVFCRKPWEAGGDSGLIDWFLTMGSILNKSYIENQLYWLVGMAFSRFAFKNLYIWTKSKLERQRVSPQLLLDAIYSREKWEIDYFDESFQINDKHTSVVVLKSFGYVKNGNYYKLKKKKEVSDFTIVYEGSDVFVIEDLFKK